MNKIREKHAIHSLFFFFRRLLEKFLSRYCNMLIYTYEWKGYFCRYIKTTKKILFEKRKDLCWSRWKFVWSFKKNNLLKIVLKHFNYTNIVLMKFCSLYLKVKLFKFWEKSEQIFTSFLFCTMLLYMYE